MNEIFPPGEGADPVRCPLCDACQHEALFTTRDRLLPLPGEFAFVRCRSCGLAFVSPPPSWAARQPHYDLNGYRGYHRRSRERSSVGRGLMAYGLHKRQRLLEAYLPEGGRLLDVGFGSGDFLAWMGQDSRWQVMGLERTPAAAQAAGRAGRPALLGDLNQAGLASGSFEAVTLWAVLEHLPDPLGGLRACARLLRPGGLLVVRTVVQEAWGRQLFGPCWVGYDAPRLLVAFDRTSLAEAFRRAGFVLLALDSRFHDFHPTLWSLQNLLEERLGRPGLVRALMSLVGSWPVRLASYPFFALQTRLGGTSFVTAIGRKP